MKHIVLLGDSIFDNAAYVGGGLDVTTHLRKQMPAAWKVTLKAVDGSVIRSVQEQLTNIPEDATHLVVSAGGNDALGRADILGRRAQSAAEVLSLLADVCEEFGRVYRETLWRVLSVKLPTAVCTVYYPRFPDPALQRIAVAALASFNDIIIREAFRAGVPLIDLRLTCASDADYANPIEPSEAGGAKIAAAIIRLVAEHQFERRRTEVFF